MYDWIIESLMGGCQNYTECEIGQGACGCKGFGDKDGEVAEAGRETVKADGALCSVGGYYISYTDKLSICGINKIKSRI